MSTAAERKAFADLAEAARLLSNGVPQNPANTLMCFELVDALRKHGRAFYLVLSELSYGDPDGVVAEDAKDVRERLERHFARLAGDGDTEGDAG